MTGRIVLTGISPQIRGLNWDFAANVRIGRQPTSDLVLQHTSVHRQHAEIFLTPRGWMIRDLSELAGATLVNGMSVSKTPRRLQKSDVLHIGKLELRVDDIKEEAAPTTPTVRGPADIKTTGPIVCIQAQSQRSWEQSLHEVKRDQKHPQESEQFLTLLQGGYYLARVHNASDFFQAFLDDTLAMLDAQRAALVLYDLVSQEFELRTLSLSKGPSRGDRCFSATLVRRCFFKGESVLCQDVARENNTQVLESGLASTMGSIVCIVIRTPRRKLGVLHLDRGAMQKPFSQESFALAEAIVASMSAAIECALTVENQYAHLAQQGQGLAKVLLEMVDARAVERGERVSKLAVRIGEELRLELEEKQQLMLAGMLLELGKVPSPLPGENTSGQIAPQKDHVVRAAEALAAIPGLEQLAPLVRGHQEKWNGSGSPDGLAEHDIPRLARILAVARCVDDKLYSDQAPLTPPQVIDWCKARAGVDFDPECVEALESVMSKQKQ